MLECYELLDFGNGRKLERFGEIVLDRIAPAAEGSAPAHPSLWKQARVRYRRIQGERGTWSPESALPKPWRISFAGLTMELKLNEFGHVGLFPEQAENWEWLARQVSRAQRPLHVLNLFAYTGAASLAAAAAGAHVTHVDAARNVVTWARRNAQLSGLAEAPIRWIAEDALKFVQRELRRGRTYEAVILDPPSYGHGPRGEPWVLQESLPELLRSCAELTRTDRAFFLLTCHSPGFGPPELQALLSTHLFGSCAQPVRGRRLSLSTAEGNRLACGAAARWP